MINRCLIHVYFKPIIPFNECNGTASADGKNMYIKNK